MDLSLKKHTVVKALKLNQGAWRKAFIIIVRKVHALSCWLIWVKCGSFDIPKCIFQNSLENSGGGTWFQLTWKQNSFIIVKEHYWPWIDKSRKVPHTFTLVIWNSSRYTVPASFRLSCSELCGYFIKEQYKVVVYFIKQS